MLGFQQAYKRRGMELELGGWPQHYRPLSADP
jgi:hypothetical protein